MGENIDTQYFHKKTEKNCDKKSRKKNKKKDIIKKIEAGASSPKL